MSKATGDFAALTAVIDRYKRTVKTALETYKTEAEKLSERLNERTLKEEKAVLAAEVRKQIEAADTYLADAIGSTAQVFREELRERVGGLGKPDILRMLRLVKDFGLTLTNVEVDSLVEQAKGDLTSLRLIQAVAKDSGIHVDIPSVGALVSDVERFERLSRRVPMGWAPGDLSDTAAEVFPVTIMYGPHGGKVGYGEQATARDFFLSSGVLNGLLDDFDRIKGRWREDAPVKITAVPLEVVETAKQRREEEARAAAVVQQYAGD